MPRLRLAPPLIARWLCLGLALGFMTACVKLYRVDVRQGNQVSQEMVAQLRPGMTEEQVRFIMGTPLLKDPFQAGRWDYLYRFAPGGKPDPAQSRRVTLFFADGKLVRVEGDVIAGFAPDAQSQPAPASR